MTSRLHALCFDAHDPQRLARFWGGVLARPVEDGPDGAVTVAATEATQFRLQFNPSAEEKRGPNRAHLHLTSAYPQQQQETVDRVLQLGGSHLDVGQRPEEPHVVLADPEGNELCVIPAGNRFLSDTAFLGEVSADGSQAVGYFWHEALGWPLVWDQDGETAVQSPQGGAKLSWGGPPVAEKVGRNRLHLHVVPVEGGRDDEVERLLSLGARRLGAGPAGDASGTVLGDPDGNEFCVLDPGLSR
jgi:hypothetical protein